MGKKFLEVLSSKKKREKKGTKIYLLENLLGSAHSFFMCVYVYIFYSVEPLLDLF